MSATVTLTHPNLPGATYSCFPQQVEIWEALGWEQQKTTKKAPAKAADDTTTSDRADKPAARKES